MDDSSDPAWSAFAKWFKARHGRPPSRALVFDTTAWESFRAGREAPPDKPKPKPFVTNPDPENPQ